MMTTVQKKILIVEDDEDVYDFVGSFLESKGYDIRVAKDGGEGLQQIREFQPDLVILDLMMPRLDGFGLLKLMSSAGPRQPKVIVVTAVQKMGGRDEALQLGASDFLTKPVDSEALLEKIKRLI